MTKAAQAREAAGLSVEDAAKRARICTAYLRRVERQGASYPLAERLARIYQCPINNFLIFGAAKPKRTTRRTVSEASGEPQQSGGIS